MIKLKEGVATKLILEITDKGIPFDGGVSFGIYNKKGDIVWQTEGEVKEGMLELTMPKIKENDYRFALETDEGYSDIQDLIVSKSIREPKGELQRKYQIDINNERDEKYEKNIGKNKVLMNEFYMNNGKRIKKIETDIEEYSKKGEMDKEEMHGKIGEHRKEIEQTLELFSEEIEGELEGIKSDFVLFEKSSDERATAIENDLQEHKTNTNVKFNETGKKIDTITQAIGDISKTSEKNGLSLSEKIKSVEKKIPTADILTYEVNDEGLDEKILWSSVKIDKRIRGEVGRQKRVVSSQNMFDTIAVSGQDDIQPETPLDELTLAAGSNMTITTDATTKTITFESTGGGTPGGSDTQVQFNDGGSFGGDAHFTYDKTNDVLHVHKIAGDATDGLLIESANGTDIGILGAANTANVTWYGSHNYNTATQDTIAIFTGAGKTLGSAATATYPSLTELTFLKGVTSAIQAQLNSKGDVTKVGTPVDNQIAVRTGDGTVEGTTKFTRDDTARALSLGVEATETIIQGKDATTNATAGSSLLIKGGAGGPVSGAGGNLSLYGGSATAGNSNGGSFYMVGGSASGSGTAGGVYLAEGTENSYIDIQYNTDMYFRGQTKMYAFQGNGVQAILDATGVATTNKTFTLPNATTTLVGTNTTDTLSNKTLTAPKFVDLGFIADANGNELIIFDTVASAVNEITLANAATAGNPTITATGDDANVGIDFVKKGSGKFNFRGNSTEQAQIRLFEDSDNGTNSIGIKTAASVTADVTYTLPAAPAVDGYGMTCTTAGVMSWVEIVTPTSTSTLSNKTLSGATILEENASLQLDGVLSADGKRSGITITATAGYTQAFGDLVYLDPTDSRWEACDANAASGADGDCRGLIGMVVSAGTDGNACTILLQGTIRADANFPALTVGGPVYAAETAGDVVVTAPSTSGAVVRVLGSALTADSMFFNPSGDFIVNV